MANNGGPPLPRQLIKRVPPNTPRDIAAAAQSPEYDPSGMYGYGSREQLLGTKHQLAQIVFPPWIYPPPNAGHYVYRVVDATVGPGPVTVELNAVTATLGTSVFQIPNNNFGIMRSFNLNVNNLLATSDIVFSILVNGGAIQGHDELRVFPRAAASVSEGFSPEETVLPLPEGARVSFRVTVTDAVAYQLGISWRGWYYGKDLANRYGQY